MYKTHTCQCGHREAMADNISYVCRACGRVVKPAEGEPLSERPRISIKAIASVCIGAFFFLPFFFTGIPAILLGTAAEREIDRSYGRLRGRNLANCGGILGVIGCLFTLYFLLVPGVGPAHEHAPRAQCVNNLKQIGLAIMNYESVYGCFPPASITDKNGKPLLSWRVAILEFMGQNRPYLEFHLDEPWDSPHNLRLLDQMPNSYVCPAVQSWKPGQTGYVMANGAGMGLTTDSKALKIGDFTDGLSDTILVAETRTLIPWTKPDDQRIELDNPPFGLSSYHSHGFNTEFADGSVKFIKETVKVDVLRALLTRDGHEVLPKESY